MSPNQIFSQKKLIKFSCNSWPLLLCKIKKAWDQIWKVMITYHFWDKMTKLLWMPWIRSFFRKTINMISMSLLAFFIVQNCKTILTPDPELFGSSMAYLSQTRIFWKKSFIFFSFTYWPLSLCKIFKKFLEPIESYEDLQFHFWG